MSTTELAIDGGELVRAVPLTTAPPPAEQDIAAAVAVLRSGVLGGPDHPAVRSFEAALAEHGQRRHVFALSSGTTALHCVLEAMGVGSGDEVIVPAQTFIASATPVLMCGATPVVVDVEPDSHCIAPDAVAEAVTSRTRAVVAVHLNGHPAAVDRLPLDIPVISDACQAHGAMLFGRPVEGTGHASVLSFWQDKLITTGGEGGAVLSDDDDLAAAIRLIRSHAQEAIPGSHHQHHVRLGYNYRLTGVQAAMGESQLHRLPRMLTERRASAEALSELLRPVDGLTTPSVRPGATHVFWKYVVRLDLALFTADRDTLAAAIRAEGVPAAPRYPIPLTRQPVIADHGRIHPCPVAEGDADSLLTLGMPWTADETDLADVAMAVTKVLAAYRR